MIMLMMRTRAEKSGKSMNNPVARKRYLETYQNICRGCA